MGFMHTYKRLDNLCRDINGIGVTGYIEDMEYAPNGINLVPGWKNDFLKLKHYRHIRNQIAHENDADEDNMCSYEDENWIENFYNRIMVQSDPLALYRKATLPRPVSKPTTVEAPQKPQYTPSYNNAGEPTHKPQYLPANNAGRRMRKLVRNSIMTLLTIVVLAILLLTILFVLFG